MKECLSSRTLARYFAGLAASGVLFLCGCLNTMVTTAPEGNSFVTSAGLGGKVHGGQFPIIGATVNLYSAGTAGYGQGSTLLATTTSVGPDGHFSFTNTGTLGSSSGTTSTYSCPTSGNPLLYITAVGGNTQNTGSVTNSAAGLMAAVGQCLNITSSTTVLINEITTVATVFAMAPYISTGATSSSTAPSAGAETMGAPNTAQAQQGLLNAFGTIQNLASIAGGLPITTQTYTGTNSSVTGVTVTATPESSKLITIADILAACINTATSASNNCADLFANALPPQSASVTSQPAAFFPILGAASDTIQAAYYMAVNPIDAGTFTSCNDGQTTALACLFNLNNPVNPFQPALAAAPTDWTIGVTYTASGYCGTGTANTNLFFNGPAKESVDASGNLWFVNGASANATFAGISPVGKPLACVGYGASAGAGGSGVAVDPSGNIWATYNNSATQGLLELPSASIASATAAVPWATAFSFLGLTIDGSGNIFLGTGNHSNNDTKGGGLLEIPSPGATVYTASTTGSAYSTTATYPGVVVAASFGTLASSNTLAYLAPDKNGNIWGASSNETGFYNAIPTTFTITGYSVASSSSVIFCTTTATSALTTSSIVTVNGTGTSLDRQGYAVSSTTLTSPCTTNSFTATLISAGQSTYGTPNTTGIETYPTLTSSGGALTVSTGTATAYTTTSFATNGTPYFTGNEFYGLAFDSNGWMYSGTNCCTYTGSAEIDVIKFASPFTSDATYAHSAQAAGGNNGARGVALDGAGNIWATNALPSNAAVNSTNPTPIYAIAENHYVSGTGAATYYNLSTSGSNYTAACATNINASSAATCAVGGGFEKASFLSGLDIAVDPSGNVWVPNTGQYVFVTSNSFTYNGSSITEVVGAAVPVVTPTSVAAGTGTQATKP